MKDHIQRVIVALILMTAWCTLEAANGAEIYYTNRTFTAVEFGNQIRPADILNAESKKLTNIVKGAAVQLDSNGTYAIERNAVALGHNSAAGAWNAAVNYNYERNHNGKIFDNVGWVRGTKLAHGEWGAYLWTLRNKIAFKSSAANIWVSSNGIPVAITNVMVGSLGDYQPMADVVDIGPDISEATNSYPGAGESDSGTYYADITNVYYQLVSPGIWITPRDVVVAVGSSSAVRFTVTGTNITNGVTWTLNPSGLSGGAEMQANGYWYYRDVMPGNVATTYIIRATSVGNTNLYDEVSLTVLKVEITPSGDTIDGNNSGQFAISIQPSGVSVDSYQWTWQAPEESGNYPQVNYATPNQQSTIVNNAHWFAFPDDPHESETGLDCEYTVNCTVTINGVQCVDSTPPTWQVYLPNPAALTSWPQIAGTVTIGVREVGGSNEWYVSGMGTLTRTTPQITSNIIATSQFYNKFVTVHEGRHVTQLTTGVSGMTLHLLWNANALYNSSIVNKTSNVNEADLLTQVGQVIGSQNEADDYNAATQAQTAEDDADQQSDAVDPDYLEE